MLYLNEFTQILKDPERLAQFNRDHAHGEPIEISLEGYDAEECEQIFETISRVLRQHNPDLVVTDRRGRA